MGNALLRVLVLLILLVLGASKVFAKDYVRGELVFKYKTTKKFGRKKTGGLSRFKEGGGVSNIISLFEEDLGIQVKILDDGKQYKEINSEPVHGGLFSKLLGEKEELVLVELENLDEEIPGLIARIRNDERFKDSGVDLESLQPNYIFETSAMSSDALASSQWALQTLKADEAWSTTRGEGAVVAVIDTGVDYNHPDLKKNIWVNKGEIPNNKKDDDKNGFVDDVIGWDFVKNATSLNCALGEDCKKRDKDPMDFHGHGTHVAGIIAAVQNNNIGVSGIAPGAKIMPLKAAFASGRTAYLKSTDVYEAIRYAADNGADVINMSFAGPKEGIVEEAVNYAHKKGTILVAAAGNAGTSTKYYPAALKNVISVGATDSANERAYFSNYGNWVDIYAPGHRIISTSKNAKYVKLSGTSMASPYVAGVAALIRAKSRFAKPNASQVLSRMLESSTDVLTVPGAKLLSAATRFPIALDELIVPERVIAGDHVMLEAKASDDIGEASEYEWSSNIDGFLTSDSDLSADDLSLGKHMISVRAKSRSGEWSKPIETNLEVLDEAIAVSENSNLKIVEKKGKLIAKSKYPKGLVDHYKWRSDIAGYLTDKERLSVRELEEGDQRVFVSVVFKDGTSSMETEKMIRI